MKGDDIFQIEVTARDKVCVRCETPHNIAAHHLIRRKYLKSRHDIRNGVSLCKEHHDWAHQHPNNDEWLAWGREGAQFTQDEWQEYKRRIMGIERIQ